MTLEHYLRNRRTNGRFSTDRVLAKITDPNDPEIAQDEKYGWEHFETSDGHRVVIEFSEDDEMCGNIISIDGELCDA